MQKEALSCRVSISISIGLGLGLVDEGEVKVRVILLHNVYSYAIS